MTTPPLGIGYPDGGKIASQWGDPLVAVASQAFANGAQLYAGYVGNFTQLQINLTRVSNIPLVVFTWWADAAFTQYLGSTDVCVDAVHNEALVLLSNQGPYLAITLETADANPSTLSLNVTPGTGVTSAQMGVLSNALQAGSAAVGAGAATVFTSPIVRSGRAKLFLTATVQPASARLYFFDFTGTRTQFAGIQTSGATGFVEDDVVLPPYPIDIQLNNSSAGAGTLGFALIIDPH